VAVHIKAFTKRLGYAAQAQGSARSLVTRLLHHGTTMPLKCFWAIVGAPHTVLTDPTLTDEGEVSSHGANPTLFLQGLIRSRLTSDRGVTLAVVLDEHGMDIVLEP
jgi:hypothetical protein